MAMIKTAVKGMKDVMPDEMRLRNYVMGVIRETYESYGFTQIDTPSVEHIENLNSKQGGENEKLIFKIMKRGDKLAAAASKLVASGSADDLEGELVGGLSDSGLRYDLTLPLSRYYSNNANDLPSPFKALQMGPVWRADKPQRGRYRQFMQCDIDILGEANIIAETELILATTTLLGKLDFRNFSIRINDRRILKAMAASCGFSEDSYDSVFITLDKMDKIGLEGVKEELLASGYNESSVEQYIDLFSGVSAGDVVDAETSVAALRKISDKISNFLDKEVADNLETIITSVEGAKAAEFALKFDPTLVRGMSYYTGPIFEISMDEYGGSVGGGGRYDEMIGKFTGQPTPAVGFSIGFERIVMLLLENDFQVPGSGEKKAYLIEKGMPAEKMKKILELAGAERREGKIVNISIMKKNKKFQKEKMQQEGYTDFVEFFTDREF